MKVFDPWEIDFETQVALNEADELTAEQDWQIVMARSIAERRDAILGGSGLDVMQAVDVCARWGLAMPPWLWTEFHRRVQAVTQAQVSSWDDEKALGRPYPKGTHLSSVRKQGRAGPVIVHIVKKILADAPQTPIDDMLFEQVAERLRNQPGLGRSEVSRLYYAELTRSDKTSGKS